MQKSSKKKKENFLTKAKRKIKKTIRLIGPGFVTGSADDDPSGIGTYSIAGAKFGLLMLWLVPFLLPLMFVIQEMCARIGLVTGKGLTANMKKFFSKPVLYSAIFILVVANVINIGADISIMASSLKLVFGFNVNFWAIFVFILIVLMEIFISYRIYSKILIFLSLFLLAYVVTAFMTSHDFLEIIKYTFIPHFKFTKDFILIAIGFFGTTISPYLFFWQTSHEVEELHGCKKINHSKKTLKDLIRKVRFSTFVGMFYSQMIALFIVITCYSTLHKSGITEINSAAEAAMALRPLAGDWAFLIFSIGIIGAGFLGIPVLAGATAYALSELFNFKASLSYKFKEAKFFYGVIALATLVGLFINFIGVSPIKALLYAAVVNGICAIPLIAFIIILANKTEVMGEHKNKFFSNFIGYITLGLMLLSVVIIFM